MFNTNIKSKLFLTLVTFSFSFSAFAQEVEEIVVTATKKEESTQDIAVSITAITADQLAADQIYQKLCQDLEQPKVLALVQVLP